MPHHQHVLMGQICLVQELWLRGRYAEVEQRIEEAVGYGREHDLDYYLDYLLGHRHRLQALRGDWATAEAGLWARLAAGENGSGSGTGAARHALPALAQLLVRRGAEDAQAVLARAVAFARRADSSYELVPALLAEIEQAWLLGRPAAARAARRDAGRAHGRCRCGTPARRAARWQRRLGEPVEAFPGCPDELAAGIRGDWRAAAAAWQALGDPYAAALELAEGDTDARLAALTRLDELGARPAAARVRRDLRRAGVTVIPRGPKPTTRENPAGLTDRQVEILRLLADGRDQRRDRRAARALGAHGRPPRLGRAAEARRDRPA